MKLTHILLAALLALPAIAQAQTQPAPRKGPAPEPPIYPAPEGVWVVISGTALNPEKPSGRLVGARVFRADAGSNSYKELGQIREAATLADFRAIAGPSAIDALKATQKLASDEAAWAFLERFFEKMRGDRRLRFTSAAEELARGANPA